MKEIVIRLLRADEIECRVSVINERGLSLLLFKDARVDQKILDETFTPFGWKRSHQVIDGNLYCTVEVWDAEKGQWIGKHASEVAPVPIVNAGDGANQHPSQTMLDLYSIYKTQGTLENLNIFLVGDLKYGRTVHSLLMAMRHFNPTFHFIAPEELKMPEEYKLYCKTHQIKYVEHTDFSEEIIADADILYMTRVQRERFTDLMEYERVKNVYILRNKMLEHTRPNLRILHPLPRVNEIAYDVDDNPKAYYFQQAQNGLYAREAILCDVLGITLEDVKNDILL